MKKTSEPLSQGSPVNLRAEDGTLDRSSKAADPCRHAEHRQYTRRCLSCKDTDTQGCYRPAMADLLPAIDIKVSVEPSLFLERMIAIGRQTGRFTIEHVDDRAGGTRMEIANLRLSGDSPHEGHGFQLIARAEQPARIQVEMRAQHWSPEPPTRAVYEQSARDLVGDLLKGYNRSFGTRHRLRIGAREARPFKLSQRTKTLLDRFTTLANTRALHPFDWRRFYQLVREGRQEMPGHVLCEKLELAGFASEKARELAQLYARLWEFKRLR